MEGGVRVETSRVTFHGCKLAKETSVDCIDLECKGRVGESQETEGKLRIQEARKREREKKDLMENSYRDFFYLKGDFYPIFYFIFFRRRATVE